MACLHLINCSSLKLTSKRKFVCLHLHEALNRYSQQYERNYKKKKILLENTFAIDLYLSVQ